MDPTDTISFKHLFLAQVVPESKHLLPFWKIKVEKREAFYHIPKLPLLCYHVGKNNQASIVWKLPV